MVSLRTLFAIGKREKTRAAVEPSAGAPAAKYVAFIMDGNGRWAKRRHLPVAAGHRAGAKALRRILEHALDLGIKEVTVYAFSTENWSRSQQEVAALMQLFVEMIDSQVPEMHERGARVRFIGSRSGVPQELAERINQAEYLTADNTKMTLAIAFNYGGRRELVDAAERLVAERCALLSESGGEATSLTSVNEEQLRRHLYAPELHDPELLIRTSGELRTSNFLLWQSAYSELFFSEKLWPDFSPADLDEALADYAGRQRRFGGRSPANTIEEELS